MCHEKHSGPHFWAGCGSFSASDFARMKRMAGHFMRNFMGGFGIPYNIEDLGNEYLIVVPLPGRTKDNVEVSLINKNINVKAKKPTVPEHEKKEEKPKEEGFPFPWKGFRFIDVNMDIPLPADADEESISSKMSNGLLRITMGKKPAKHIDINEGGGN